MHLDRRRLVMACFAAATLTATPAFAFQAKAPFSAQAFAAAQAAGKPILIDVTAPWCPTCKAQAPILSRLGAKPRYAGFTVFEVDFDSQKEALRLLNARQQSTLIVFKGNAEAGRSVGDTNAASIEALLEKAI